MNTTPVSLLERLQHATDQEAWVRFVELYTPLLFHWARRAGEQEADAADLVQDVFAVLVEKLPEFRYDAQRSFRAWLRTLVLNRWRDRQRRKAVRPRLASAAELENLTADDEVRLFDEVEFQRHLVRRAMELMQTHFQPATWRACWEMVVAGRPAAEVAAELGVREGTVYAARSRVLHRLRQELAGMLD